MEAFYDFRKFLCQPHRPHRNLKTMEGVAVNADWRIVCPEDAGAVLQGAAADLQDYFAVSMDVKLKNGAAGEIRYAVDPALPPLTYEITAAPGCITLTGCDERRAAQAGYALEDAMNLNECPVIAPQTIRKTARFSPRMVHTGLGDGLYPDGHLRMLAHAGMDAIIVGTGDVLTDDARAAEVNELCARAAAIGLDVYTFAGAKNLYHPDDPEAEAYYESTYGALFEKCPGIHGINFVGEACEFPSKDPRTTGKSRHESLGSEKPSPGWFPCDDYPEFISFVARIIRRHAPETDVIFWTYNWGYAPAELRLPLLEKLPQDISLMSTFEMFEPFSITPEVQEVTTDYTLWYVGPGEYFDTENRKAGELGHRMYAMSNTAGGTWDIGVVPYLPAPYQWLNRYEAVTDAQDEGGLCGLQESWTYGFWPSIMPELAKNAFSLPAEPGAELLEKLIIRDYGAEAADLVLDALAAFSEASSHCVSTNEDQYGPCRIGPSYPLFFERHEPLPKSPTGSPRDPNGTCNPVYRYHPEQRAKLEYETLEYQEMARLYARGNAALEEALPLMPPEKRANGEALYRLGRFIQCTAETTVHVKQWHACKLDLGIFVDTTPIWIGGRREMPDAQPVTAPVTPDGDAGFALEELLRIGEAEIANAEAAISLVEADSRLGYTQELDYCTSPAQLRWKIAVTRRAMDEEIRPRLAALGQ